MKCEIDGILYDVIIVRKNNKNIYIRIKEDKKIYVTCNYFTNKFMIKSILNKNMSSLRKMLLRVDNEKINKEKFLYLGNEYDIVFDDKVSYTYINDNKIFSKDKISLDKWYKDETIKIFDERFVYVFNHFKEQIKSPILKIRNMKTRWGVYNRIKHTITLNSKLIEFDIEKIDYVIIHELCHIIYFNHSKNFWNLVQKYCKNYKLIRKEMRD